MNMYPNAILVNVSPSGIFAAFQTFDRRHRRSNRFFVNLEALDAVICGDHREHIEYDIGSFVRFRMENDGRVQFTFYWMRTDNTNSIMGYTQTFCVPVSILVDAMNGKSSRLVILDPNAVHKAKVDIMPSAHKVIRNLDAAHRNALRKALRDSFNYGEASRVTLYGDGSRDFYFADSGIHGGLVCHTNRHGGKYYQIHT